MGRGRGRSEGEEEERIKVSSWVLFGHRATEHAWHVQSWQRREGYLPSQCIQPPNDVTHTTWCTPEEQKGGGAVYMAIRTLLCHNSVLISIELGQNCRIMAV